MNGDFICGKVLSMRYKGKTPVLLVEGIGTREAAEALIGADVYADRNALAPLGEDSYYVDAIIGFAVVDERGGRMGELVGVIDNPAHDILRIASVGGDRELLLPMVDEFVLSVDVAARQIRVRPPDGLDGI
jgi:16S rRNA processing protein RimM